MSTLPAPTTWWTRTWATITGWWRGTPEEALATLPPRPGVAFGRVASSPQAEGDLAQLAASPTVYAAVTRRAHSFLAYPLRVTTGQTWGPAREPVPDSVPWLGSFFRLLDQPNPQDEGVLAPAPGEYLVAQLLADLMLTGNCWVLPTLSESGTVIGLARIHPGRVFEVRDGKTELIEVQYGVARVRYPRSSVFHCRLVSWSKDGAGLFGTGAGESLRPVVAAESQALRQTAQVIEQGGVDVFVTPKSAAAQTLFATVEGREKIAKDVTTGLRGVGGRRVMAMSTDIEIRDSGLKPADIRAPEMAPAARDMELLALGCTPVSVGSATANYATAVQQARTQAQMDEELSEVLCSGFLRPLARHFARLAGGRARERAWSVQVAFDMAGHPGYAYLRTDAINRAAKLQDMGFSASQALEMEKIDAPKPLGTPKEGKKATETPGPDPGSTKDDPRRPVGDAGEADPGADPDGRAAEELFGGSWN